jgi:thiosulfate dehydrogenase [quinone] large subunit
MSHEVGTFRPTGACRPAHVAAEGPSDALVATEGGIEMQKIESATIEEPGFARWLFASKGAAGIWTVVRLFLGYQWLHAGWEKITGVSGAHWYSWGWGFTQDSWLRSSASLKGFAGYALQGAGHPYASVNYGWYAAFLRFIVRSGGFLAPIIAIGEFMIGLGLIVGLFVGVAAFFGAILNVSFGLAGVAGVNPMFFLLAVFLILAWRNAGYYGLDRYALPMLGTPWHPGKLFHHEGLKPVAA